MAKKTLTNSYRKNIDYTITKTIKPTGRGGQKREIILLTIRCFKKTFSKKVLIIYTLDIFYVDSYGKFFSKKKKTSQ